MQKAKDYLTLNGWKADLEETARDIKDTKVLVKRLLGLSHYGFKNNGEMTSRKQEDLAWISSAFLFENEKKFGVYQRTSKWPLGHGIIGHGKHERRYDDGMFIQDNKKNSDKNLILKWDRVRP